MTKLLEAAIARLRQFPAEMQDTAARALMQQLEDEPEPGDREAIEKGREEFGAGEFSTLKEWRHEVAQGWRLARPL